MVEFSLDWAALFPYIFLLGMALIFGLMGIWLFLRAGKKDPKSVKPITYDIVVNVWAGIIGGIIGAGGIGGNWVVVCVAIGAFIFLAAIGVNLLQHFYPKKR